MNNYPHTSRVLPPAPSSSGRRYYVLLNPARGRPGIYPGWSHFCACVTRALPAEYYGFATWEEAANLFLQRRQQDWDVVTYV